MAVSSSALTKAALVTPRHPAPVWEGAARDKRTHCAQKGQGFISPHPSTGRCAHMACIQLCVCTLIPCSLQDTRNFNFLVFPGAFLHQLQLWLPWAALCCAQRWAVCGRKELPLRECHLHPFVCDWGHPSTKRTHSPVSPKQHQGMFTAAIGGEPQHGAVIRSRPPRQRCHEERPLRLSSAADREICPAPTKVLARATVHLLITHKASPDFMEACGSNFFQLQSFD